MQTERLRSGQAAALKDAGLMRLNISLDALNADVFKQITRREGFQRVLEGIFAAKRIGFEKIKLNAVKNLFISIYLTSTKTPYFSSVAILEYSTGIYVLW